MHPAAISPAELLKEIAEIRTRRSGPGGQHRNKTETAVVLVHEPTGISAEASERRSQAENRSVALGRLRMKLALEHRSPAPAAGPSALWLSKTRDRRLVVSPDHVTFPAVVAEALDHLQTSHFEIRPAAERLGVSGSQLVRLFKNLPAAWITLNRYRVAAGLPLLK